MGPGFQRIGRLGIAAAVALVGCFAVIGGAGVDAHNPTFAKGKGSFYAKCFLSRRAPDDPIVFPGQPGMSHLHDFLANTTTNAYTTPDSLAAGDTTCQRKADKSAYWVPTLYDENGKPVNPYEAFAFYSVGIRDPSTVQPFPKGFRMIAGDSKARQRQVGPVVNWDCAPNTLLNRGASSPTSPRARALRAMVRHFARLAAKHHRALLKLRRQIRRTRLALRHRRATGSSTAGLRRSLARSLRRERHERRKLAGARSAKANRAAALKGFIDGGGTSIPTCKPGPNLRLNVTFGDCWDGQHLDTPDHKSHVAYSKFSKSADGWVCPSDHPVQLPILRLHVRYPIDGGPDIRLSPGDVDAGHADFFNGWDEDKLTYLVQTCLQKDVNCGNGDKEQDGPAPITSPQPGPSPSPEPSPDPDPSPPPPDPNPDPNPLPLPGLP
jgi:hypothetical protein